MCRWCGEDQSFGVNGIIYDPCDPHGVHEREMFEVLDPHPWEPPYMCPLCNVEDPVLSWHHVVSDGMRWSPDYPIVRFTSEGLQTVEPANV